MKTLLAVVGTRPEAIKMAPAVAAFRESTLFRTHLLLSGQHKNTPEEILSAFGVRFDEKLVLCRRTDSLNGFFARALVAVDGVLKRLCPDAVAVHGDTATAAAAALAAFHARVPVFHVEAGLRTGDLSAPFPEECYRLFIDKISALAFAPTEAARQNLLREGKAESTVLVTGNTAIDALYQTVSPNFTHPILKRAASKKLVIVTLHRRENEGRPFSSVCRALRRVLAARTDTLLLFVMHPSPARQKRARECLAGTPHLLLSPPLDHGVFQNLLSRAALLLTDSGGIQEEACALGIPTLVLREKTERAEGTQEGGALFLIGTEEKAVADAFHRFLDAPPVCAPDGRFGDGKASCRIRARIDAFFRAMP